ncbi:MAG: MIP family channel protein [Armatimonadota bacterium]
MARDNTLIRECLAEVIGTFILVFFGIGAVHVAVLTDTHMGLWQVAVVWGVAVSLAIYTTGAVSGAHLNPAITLAFATYRQFPWRKVPLYLIAQVLGAFLAAATLYLLFQHLIGHFEMTHHLQRGMPGSELSGMIYGEYFPNPALLGDTAAAFAGVTLWQAMLAEAIGTAFLAFFVFVITDQRNPGHANRNTAAILIGLVLAVIIALVAPLTQAGLNPARDFGPRLFAWLAGWGSVAIPGPRGGFFTVYLLAPMLGASFGAAVYQYLVRPALPAPDDAVLGQYRKGNTIMSQVKIVLVGGFLGAGKTTLLGQTARQLLQQGQRVGLITNDQAAQLVDTGFLQGAGLSVEEIAGGCFCCKFDDLINAADKLVAEQHPDILLGEPVGSCTDISATVLQPLKEQYRDRFTIAPFSVLVDPDRLEEVLNPEAPTLLHPSARYILGKQLEEADIIVLNKIDLLTPAQLAALRARVQQRFPAAQLYCISALTGEGVDAWLAAVRVDQPAGKRIVEVDYDVYAEGEAVLGWLNATARLTADGEVDWRAFCLQLMQSLQTEFQQMRRETAHLKLLLVTSGGQYVANLTRTLGTPAIRGSIAGHPHEAALVLNARVEMTPEELQEIVERILPRTAGKDMSLEITTIRSLSPGRPQPVHRYAEVV